MSNSHDAIRAYVRRAERLDEELAALNADKSELFKEAKSEGFDATALKAVIAYRRKREKVGEQAMAEQDSVFATYLHAVEGGTPVATRAGARDEEAGGTSDGSGAVPGRDVSAVESREEDFSEATPEGQGQTAAQITSGHDDLDIPEFLRRAPAEAAE